MSICTPSNPCCCREAPGLKKQCWISGECCKKGTDDEYWDPVACFDLDIWVEPKSMIFTIGKKIPVTLYVQNTGTFTDSYDIDYEITVGNPALIKVDMTGSMSTGSLAPREIKRLFPRITVLSTDATGNIVFNATSIGDPDISKTATLNIKQSDFPISLHEFGFLGLFLMMILVGVIYFIFKSKH